MPAVTVPARPSGEPTAITGSPTAILPESPSAATVTPGFSTLSTARSVFGSRPTTRASAADWSEKSTRRLPRPAATAEITWLLVST